MNRIITPISVVLAFIGLHSSLFAQNILLQRAFWKEKPSIEIIKQKISEGHDPEELNTYGFDAVVYALLEKASLEVIDYLMTYKENSVDKITHDGRNYLLWAAYKGDLDIVRYLLDAGSDAQLIDDHGYNVITFAARAGQKDPRLYNILNSSGASIKSVNHSGANALLLLLSSIENLEELDFLIDQGLSLYDVDHDGNGAFSYATLGGNIMFLKSLINEDVDPKIVGKDGRNAVLFAASKKDNSIELYQYLQKLGLNLTQTDTDGRHALHYLAYSSEDKSLLDFFISQGLGINDFNKDGNSPFMLAISGRNLDVVNDWIDQVNDINHKNNEGLTALTIAIDRANLELVNTIVDHGANFNIRDVHGNDMMYHAFKSFSARNGEETKQIVLLLEENGFLKNKNANRLLEIAIDKNAEYLVLKALGYGAQINQVNDEGMTPLHLCAMKAKDLDLINLLLDQGADKSLLTPFEESAYDLAKENELLSANNIEISVLK